MATVELTNQNFEGVVNERGTVLVDFLGVVVLALSDLRPDLRGGFRTAPRDRVRQGGHGGGFRIGRIVRDSVDSTLTVFRDQIVVFSQPGAVPAEVLETLITQVAELDMDEVHRLARQQKSNKSSHDPVPSSAWSTYRTPRERMVACSCPMKLWRT